MKKYYYITTTLPYVNSSPHLGFTMEIIRADVLARFWRLLGYEVFFNTGTDEHGKKIFLEAKKNNQTPLDFCNQKVVLFKKLKKTFSLSYNNFIRTTSEKHKKAAQKFWLICKEKGDIYKAKYKIKYCIGCELEKQESELENNRCPIHPNLELETFEEENYFFRFSKYQERLLQLYQKNPSFVIPKFRLKEVWNFVRRGLRDFSISRLKEKMPWGIPVPDDPNHVMYVWFDALINYISALGWPDNLTKFRKFWPGVQIAGKDNLRQQAAMWQAMLLSANLPPSKKIYIEGFITNQGQKMSKSLGNFIDPVDLASIFPPDSIRYYLLKEIPPFNDGDFSWQRMTETYHADLANELGNLVSRLTKLGYNDGLVIHQKYKMDSSFFRPYIKNIENFRFDLILTKIWKKLKKLNKSIDDFSPWKKTQTERKKFLINALLELQKIGIIISPFMPTTGKIIIKSTQGKIKKVDPIFPKLTLSSHKKPLF